jgi:hypothetical protein
LMLTEMLAPPCEARGKIQPLREKTNRIRKMTERGKVLRMGIRGYCLVSIRQTSPTQPALIDWYNLPT